MTFTAGSVLTAAQLNTHVRDNMIDLDRRTTITGASVLTSQTSTSTSYADLATVGPVATVTIGSTGRAQITLSCSTTNATASAPTFMGFAISGASTVAASDEYSLAWTPPVGGAGLRFGISFLLTGLTVGSTTFTAKYNVGSGTGTWLDRKINVTPLGS